MIPSGVAAGADLRQYGSDGHSTVITFAAGSTACT